jgi:hypothetical protein
LASSKSLPLRRVTLIPLSLAKPLSIAATGPRAARCRRPARSSTPTRARTRPARDSTAAPTTAATVVPRQCMRGNPIVRSLG